MRVSRSEVVPLVLAPAEPRLESAEALPSPSAVSSPSAFARILNGLGHELDHGETAMREAIQSLRVGATGDAAQLIALQAGVYRYSEAIDLASRLVDRAANGIKTVVQGGGQ